MVIAGNHDKYLEQFADKTTLRSITSEQPLSHCTYLLNSSVTICGVKFYGSPWVPVYRKGVFQLERGQQMLENWQQIPSDTDVLITHCPPLGVLDMNWQGEVSGCLQLLGQVATRVKPKFHVFGHIHESYGVFKTNPTIFINAAVCDRNYKLTDCVPRQVPIIFDVPLPEGFSKNNFTKSIES